MVGWSLLPTSFVQGILNFMPTLRKSMSIQSSADATAASLPGLEHWREEADRWRLLADKTTVECDQLRQESTQLQADVEELESEIERVKSEAEESWRQKEEALRREAEEEIMKREGDIDERQVEIRKLQAALEELRQERDLLKTRLAATKNELEGVKQMVGQDALTDSDVIKLLQGLNNDIAQAAKGTRDLFKVDRARVPAKVISDAAGAIEGWVGSTLPSLLSTQHRGNQVLVQAALQAMAVAFSSWISSSYSFMHEHDQVLDETYKYVMNGESQAVLGRWRVLTHKYAKQGMPNLAEELTNMLITDVRNLLLVAGSSNAQIDNLLSRKRESFQTIVHSAIQLRKAIGEDTISCDFETVLIHPGESFDPLSMENAFESAKNASGNPVGNVLCTAGLGLRRCKKVRLDGEKEKQWEVSVLQKPQVVLDTFMQSK